MPNTLFTKVGWVLTGLVKKTTFKVWAPKATAVKLRLYDAGNGGTAIKEIGLEKKSNGLWKVSNQQGS